MAELPGPAERDPRLSEEEYLQTVWELEEDGVAPIQARVAERLGLSSAAVSEAVMRLTERGYLAESEDRLLRLSVAGREIAIRVVRRHRLAERALVDVLGLAWEKVHREAARWEHVISDDVERRLADLLGDPATCPHGNAIPGTLRPLDSRRTVLLSVAAPGAITVSRISELLQLDDDALTLLARARLIPGCAATVLAGDQGHVSVRTPTGHHLVPTRMAAQVWVAPT